MVKTCEFIVANKSSYGKNTKRFSIFKKTESKEAMSIANTISSPLPTKHGQIWKPSREDVEAMYDKFDIPKNVMIRVIDENCNVKIGRGLRDGEIFFPYMALLVTRFPFDFLTQNCFCITNVVVLTFLWLHLDEQFKDHNNIEESVTEYLSQFTST